MIARAVRRAASVASASAIASRCSAAPLARTGQHHARSELDAFLAQLKPVRFTRQTVVSKPEIRRLILDVRKKGYALADQKPRSHPLDRVPLAASTAAVAALKSRAARAGIAKAMIADYLPLLLKEATRSRSGWSAGAGATLPRAVPLVDDSAQQQWLLLTRPRVANPPCDC